MTDEELTKEIKELSGSYVKKLYDIMLPLQRIVIEKNQNTLLGKWTHPSALISKDKLEDLDLIGSNVDYFINNPPTDTLDYVVYDEYDGILKFKDSGMPIWMQLPGESSSQYKLFTTYKDVINKNSKQKAIKTLSNMYDIQQVKVARFMEIFHWDARINAESHSKLVTHERMIQDAKSQVQREQIETTRNLSEKVSNVINNISTEELEDMTVTQLLKLFENIQELQEKSFEIDATGKKRLEERKDKEEQPQVVINNQSGETPKISGNDGFKSVTDEEEVTDEEKEQEKKKYEKARKISSILNQVMPSQEELDEEEAIKKDENKGLKQLAEKESGDSDE